MSTNLIFSKIKCDSVQLVKQDKLQLVHNDNKLINELLECYTLQELVANDELEHNQVKVSAKKHRCFTYSNTRASSGLCLRKGDFQNHLVPKLESHKHAAHIISMYTQLITNIMKGTNIL